MFGPLAGTVGPLTLRRRRPGTAPAGYNPATDTSLLLWTEADRITTLADGAAVTSEPGGLSCADTTRQPTYRTNVLNGKPVFRFRISPANDYLSNGTMARTQPYTVFAVVSTTGTTGLQYVVDGQGTNAGSIHFPGGNLVNMSAGVTIQAAATPTSWNIVEAVFNGVNSVLAVNGVETTGDCGTSNTTLTIMGNNGTGVNGLDGDIAALLINTGALTSQQRADRRNYLKAKYGL